jgi:sec-independent protein translocase protein TatA
MPSISPLELMVILVFALIILGPKRLPEVGRSLGRGLREFKDTLSGVNDEEDEKPVLTETEKRPESEYGTTRTT